MKAISILIIYCLSLGMLGATLPPPSGLSCEGATDPIAIGTQQSMLNWIPVNDHSGVVHVSWQVQAASSLERLLSGRPDLWDSRWRRYETTDKNYRGKTLASYDPCYWRVRTRSADGSVSDWSEPAFWRMGVLQHEEWKGEWIGYSEPQPGQRPGPSAREMNLKSALWLWAVVSEGDNEPRRQPAGRTGARYIFSKTFNPGFSNLDWGVFRFASDCSNIRIKVNGELVELIANPFNADSYLLPFEIDIASYIHEGNNEIEVSLHHNAISDAYGFQGVLVLKSIEGEVFHMETDNSWNVLHGLSGSERELKTRAAMWGIPRQNMRIRVNWWGQEYTTPVMRREFQVQDQVKSATVSVCGLGFYELRLNGKKVGDRVMEPAFTNYNKRVLYTTYDLTGLLQQGTNVMGLMLGNGWYNHTNYDIFNFDLASWRDEPKAMAQLRIEYNSGKVEYIVTDESWKAARSPVVYDGIRSGEVYDARLEQDGWDSPFFDDAGWENAMIRRSPAGRPVPVNMPPERVVELVQAVDIRKTDHHTYVYTFPVNTSGWPQLRVSGPAGTRVTMRCYEVEDDRLDGWTHQGPFQTNTYILKGEGEAFYEPRFSYKGFQYVELTGYPGEPDLNSLTMAVVYTDFEPGGTFHSSSDMINTIQKLTLNSFLTNYHGLPTDCPTREKAGWTADGYLAAEAGLLNFRSMTAYSKWVDDMLDCQHEDGRIPDIVPTDTWGYNGHFDWDNVIIYLPYYVYLYTGNREFLERSYDGMKACYEYYYEKAVDGVLNLGRGDWAPETTITPRAVTSTAMLSDCARIIAYTAGILGNKRDQVEYVNKANLVREAFMREFLQEDGTIGNGSQTAQSCALYFGLVPDDQRDAVLNKLIEAVSKANHHVDVGIFGAKYLFTVLSENGYHDMAYSIATQPTFPGYGWWVEQGYTTLCEHWDCSSSTNHIMFGDISAWFYHQLAGIKPLENSPGFKEFLLSPKTVDGLDFVDAQLKSPLGLIFSSWKKEGNIVEYRFEVPVNARARVILEGEPADGQEMKPYKNGQFEVWVGSGLHVFRMKI